MKLSPSYIHDPIHGQIYLTEIEMAVVDTLEFQRLRFIRQNSLLHYVFPGAFHTRFAHSLGACHIGGQIARQIIDWSNEPEIYYPLQVFRLSCLLHDIGHGAFSHSLSGVKIGERYFLPTLAEVFENPESWGLKEPQTDIVSAGIIKVFSEEFEKPIEHEVLSLLLVRKIFGSLEERSLLESTGWGDVPAKIWAQDIASLLLPEIPCSAFFRSESWDLLSGAYRDFPYLDGKEPEIHELGRDFSKVLSQLVSGTIDADRMDYLIRDSLGCGVNYGMYDKEGIVSALRLIFEQGTLKVALNAKRINTVDDFLWSRFQMFKQVYCHKTHAAYNLLLEKAMEDLVKEGSLSSPSSLSEFEQLTDDRIMSQVILETQKSPDRKDWMGAFAKRELPRLVAVVEAAYGDPIWEKSSEEIFSEYASEDVKRKYRWSDLVTTTQKAEVIKGKSTDLPAIFSFNKEELRFEKQSFLSRSVFFDAQLSEEERMRELKDRLNRRLIFFFKM